MERKPVLIIVTQLLGKGSAMQIAMVFINYPYITRLLHRDR